jgi:hypothetical protein
LAAQSDFKRHADRSGIWHGAFRRPPHALIHVQNRASQPIPQLHASQFSNSRTLRLAGQEFNLVSPSPASCPAGRTNPIRLAIGKLGPRSSTASAVRCSTIHGSMSQWPAHVVADVGASNEFSFRNGA